MASVSYATKKKSTTSTSIMAAKRCSSTIAVSVLSVLLCSSQQSSQVMSFAFVHSVRSISSCEEVLAASGAASWQMKEMPRRMSFSTTNSFLAAAPRYGPRDEDLLKSASPVDGDDLADEDVQQEWELKEEVRIEDQSTQFQELIEKIIAAEDPVILPSIMSQYLDVLMLQMRGFEIVDLMKQTIAKAENVENDQSEDEREERVIAVHAACDYVLEFMDTFVEQARSMDDGYKSLLGDIVKSISSNSSGGSSLTREQQLDEVMTDNKHQFTPGFLRHVEQECQRIATSPNLSLESAKLLETMQMVHVRIMEELGQDLGEGALVLGQLIGYDDEAERLAVLEAGLTVRGNDFAKELSVLTQEALEGFQQVPEGAVDRDLIQRVHGINDRVDSFLARVRRS
jgi:hypothetical protein